MKHIKKKFLHSKIVSNDGYDFMRNQITTKESFNNLKSEELKDYIPHILTNEKDFIQCFAYNKDGQTFIIPEPNPIVIYFSNAQINLAYINNSKTTLMKDLIYENGQIGNSMNSFYEFFGHVSNYVTSLFNSLEAFLNQQIPNNFEYKRANKKNTEIYNKEQIQRQIGFEEKIKKVIPQIKNKSFHIENSHKFEIIKKFKEFRDDIVHTKVDKKTAPSHYRELFTTSLDFEYDITILTIKEYLNYYEPELIIKCDCGAEY